MRPSDRHLRLARGIIERYPCLRGAGFTCFTCLRGTVFKIEIETCLRSQAPGGTRLDVGGRSDFSRFDPRPERPHFSNFGPPAEGACGRHQFSSLLSSLSAHLGQSHGFPTGQQWAAALKSTQPTPHCGLLSSSPRGSTTALPAAAAELRHGGEGPPRPWGRAEVLPRSPILELMLRPERMRAAHSAVARHMASGAGLAAA